MTISTLISNDNNKNFERPNVSFKSAPQNPNLTKTSSMLSRDENMPDFDAWSKTIQEMNTTSVSILKSIKDSSDTLDKLQLSITKSFRSLSKELTSSRTNFGKMLSGVGGSKTSAAGVASMGTGAAADFPETKKTEEPKKTEDNKDTGSTLGSVLAGAGAVAAGEVVKNKVEKSVAEKATAGAGEKVAETAATKAATGAGEKVAEKVSADVVKKSVAKKVGGELLKLTGKALPFGVGAAIGGVFGAMRWWEGDKLGAAAEVALGAASAIPGAGTAISVAGNIALLGRDVYNEIYGTPENPRPLDSDAAEVIAKRMPDITSALTDEFKGATKKNELSQKDTEAAIKSVGVKLGGGENRGASTTDQRSAMEINKDLSNMYQQQVSSGKIKGAGEEGGISFDVWKKQQNGNPSKSGDISENYKDLPDSIKKYWQLNNPDILVMYGKLSADDGKQANKLASTASSQEAEKFITEKFPGSASRLERLKEIKADQKPSTTSQLQTDSQPQPQPMTGEGDETAKPAYASGKDYVPKTGPAIVGEEGPELVMSKDGSARVTGSGAHVEKLKKGDSVLPADETKEALPGVGEKVPSNKSGALPTGLTGYAEGTDNAPDELKNLAKPEKVTGNDPKLTEKSEGLITDYAGTQVEKDPEKRKTLMDTYYELQSKAYDALSKAMGGEGSSKPLQDDAGKTGAPEKAPDAGASGDAPSGGDAGGAGAPAASADSGGAEAPSSGGGDSGGDSGDSMGTPAGAATSTVPPAPPETPKPETSNQPVVINNEQTTNSDSSSGGEALSTPNFPMTAQNDALTQYFQKQMLKEHN
jgi:hypothetical protein